MLLNFKKLKVGQRLLGVVKEVNDYDVVVSLPSHLTGFVSLERVSQFLAGRFEAASSPEATDADKMLPVLGDFLKVGQMVVCAIAEIRQKPKKRLELSLRATEVNAGLEITSEMLTPGTVLGAEVISAEDRGYTVGFGRGSGEVLGFLPVKESAGALREGQSLAVWVTSSKNSRVIQVSGKLGESVAVRDAANVKTLRPGCVVNAEVAGILKDRLKVKFGGVEGRMDVFQLPGNVGFQRSKDLDLADHFTAGQKIKCRILFVDGEEGWYHVSGRDQLNTTSSASLPMGSVVEECTILRVDQGHGVLLSVPGSEQPAHAHISQLSDERLEKIAAGGEWKVGSKHTVRLIDYDPFDGILVVSLKASVLGEAFIRHDEIEAGQVVKGTVERVEPYGLLVKLTAHIRAICPTVHLTETQAPEAASKYTVGSKYRFRVIDVDPKTRRVTLSRKAGLLSSTLPSLSSIHSARIGASHHAFIAAIKEYGLIVRFYGGLKGLVPVAEISDEFVERPQAAFFVGQVVQCRVIRCQPEKGELNLSLRATTGPKKRPSELREEPSIKKAKAEKAKVEPKVVEKTVKEQTVSSETIEKVVTMEKTVPAAVPATVEMTLDDLVEEEEEAVQPIPSTQKPTATTTKSTSNTVSLRDVCDEFEKRLIGQPNSSFLWIQYISALLRASEPAAARSTAERALTTIRFRDVQEKLNVWIAFLNLEGVVGSVESMQKVFERACVYNDPKTVHLALVKIYEEGGDDLKALELHRTVCKKFSQSCKVWVGHLLHLYTRLPDPSPARKLLPQALASLPKRKHIKLTCKAAQMEYRHGSVERARTLFEGILANAPKRTDIWSVYLTMEENRLTTTTDSADTADYTRRLLERIVHLRMSSKKAKTFFKRFLDFEKAHGDDAGVEHVKELARAYVESNMSSTA